MTLRGFIRAHRAELDNHITAAINRYHAIETTDDRRLNDSEREDWILNDEGLYRWAQEEGVSL